MKKRVVIIGAGGHAKVIADIIIKNGDEVVGFLDDNYLKDTKIICDLETIGKISDCVELQKNDDKLYFIIAIGNNKIRRNIAEKYDLNYYTAIHPNAVIGLEVQIDKGTVVMANTCINPNAKIGEHCIINTGAVIEHDNIIEDVVHISPNAILCGTVKVGTNTHIGAGSVVKNNINITHDCTIGAGAVVVKDIIKSGIYVGCPASKIKEKDIKR